MKVAQIGYGHLGKWHAEKAFKIFGENFYSIVEVDSSKHMEIQSLYPSLVVSSDIEEILGQVDGVIIVTPTVFHYQLIKKCLDSNINVFCEKPLTENYDQAKEIKSILRSKPNLGLQVGHSERFHKCWDDLKEKIHLSKSMTLSRRAPFKGRGTDVDIIQDLMIHDFDLIFYLWKELPISIRATGEKVLKDQLDYVTCILTFPGNKVAITHASRVSVEEQRELIATLPTGELYINLGKNEIRESRFSDKDFVTKQENYEKRDHLFIEQENFKKLIENNQEPVVGIDDALVVMKMIDLTKRSIVESKEVFWE